MKLSIFGIVLAGCAICAAQETSANSALGRELMAKSQAMLEAQQTKDVAALKRLLAEDFVQVGSDAKVHRQEEIIDDAREGWLKDYSVYEPTFVSVDDDSAIVTYNVIVNAPEGDDGLAPRYQRYSDLWVKQDGKWTLKFEQATPARHVD